MIYGELRRCGDNCGNESTEAIRNSLPKINRNEDEMQDMEGSKKVDLSSS